MTWLIIGALVFVGWLIGRRWLRIIAVCVLLWIVGGGVIAGYNSAQHTKAQR